LIQRIALAKNQQKTGKKADKTGKNLPLRMLKKLFSLDRSLLRKYFTEKNALTVMTSVFCLVMLVIALAKADFWLSIAFALAFSFSVEVICHRARENR
jgi:hypothetical protein